MSGRRVKTVPMVPVNLRLPCTLDNALVMMATEKGVSFSSLLRSILLAEVTKTCTSCAGSGKLPLR